jgi:membrane-bound metal-dependent hydrolase YbcI (DUF457 family)
MTPPFLVCLLTFPPYALLGLHSVWRFIVADAPSPMSLVQALYPMGFCWFAWVALSGTDPVARLPTMTALGLFVYGWMSVGILHLYELSQDEPYDGLFPRWRKRGRRT